LPVAVGWLPEGCRTSGDPFKQVDREKDENDYYEKTNDGHWNPFLWIGDQSSARLPNLETFYASIWQAKGTMKGSADCGDVERCAGLGGIAERFDTKGWPYRRELHILQNLQWSPPDGRSPATGPG
jgi:hypothetical protein